jgi:hypothetical protein
MGRVVQVANAKFGLTARYIAPAATVIIEIATGTPRLRRARTATIVKLPCSSPESPMRRLQYPDD